MKKKLFKRFIRTSANYVFADQPGDYESPRGISKTVPDQALTIPEMISRHVRGLPVKTVNGSYSDIETPDFFAMDLVELQEYRENLRSSINQMQSDLDIRSARIAEKQKLLAAAAAPPPDLN